LSSRVQGQEQLLEETFRAEREHFWFKGFRQFITPVVDQALAGRPQARLLDCGCGTGANLTLFRDRTDAYGFDLTPGGLGFARRQGGLRVVRASITHVPFAPAAFDVVTSFDVLQCLTEAQETQAMAGMARVLKPGGALVLNVAALDVLSGSHAVLSQEVRRYTKPLMQRALGRAGLVAERLTYTNFSLFPIMLLTRWWQRLRGADRPEAITREITVPSAPVNGALTALLSLEARALRLTDLPVGSSLLVLARKPA
jgi:ubiquinone/menaquinone biosynthesis C-methylase UbiE